MQREETRTENTGGTCPEAGEEVIVLKELSNIRNQLKCQLHLLSKREGQLRDREVALTQRERVIEDIMTKLEKMVENFKERECLLLTNVAASYSSLEDCIEKATQQGVEEQSLFTKLQNVKKDNARLKEGFTHICRINEKLKKQLEDEKLCSSQMKKQLVSLQARLTCLKLQQNSTTKLEKKPPGNTLHREVAKIKVVETQDVNQQQKELQLIYLLMEWVTTAFATSNDAVLSDKLYTSTFSLLGVLLPKIFVPEHQLTCLKFICQNLLSTRTRTLTASLRRISDVCLSHIQLKPLDSKGSETECRIRMLCCLVLLQTTVQVDVANLALQCLKYDVRLADVQTEFIAFGGISVLMPYFKHQVLCSAILDIYLLVSSNSGLVWFLSCQWFKAVVTLLSDNFLMLSPELEKLSILLQRLSTLRQSKALFTSSEIVPLLVSLSKKELSSFVHMNISSILSNIQ